MIGVELEQLAIGLFGRRRLPIIGQGHGQAEAGIDRVGGQLHGAQKMLNRGVTLRASQQQLPQCQVRLWLGFFERQAEPQRADRRVGVAGRPIALPQMEIEHRLGPDPVQALFQKGDRLAHPAQVAGQDAQHLPGGRMPGLAPQQLAISLLGFVQPAGFVQIEGLGKTGDVGHRLHPYGSCSARIVDDRARIAEPECPGPAAAGSACRRSPGNSPGSRGAARAAKLEKQPVFRQKMPFPACQNPVHSPHNKLKLRVGRSAPLATDLTTVAESISLDLNRSPSHGNRFEAIGRTCELVA